MRCGVCGIRPRTCFQTRTRTRCTPKWPPSRGRLARYADTVDPRTEGEVSGLPSNHFGLIVVAFEAANKFIERESRESSQPLFALVLVRTGRRPASAPRAPGVP
jgi:hypothetical protein